jgi:uncharacterized protein YycO
MRGDVLLLRSGGTPRDRLVAWATGGPFTHVEVDLGDGTTIGSHQKDGVAYRPWRTPERFVIIPVSQRAPAEKIEAGIAWLKAQLGHPFSWASMGDFIMPERLATILFGRKAIYNCANLVAEYLALTGELDIRHGKRPPMILSPNDIARSEGLL